MNHPFHRKLILAAALLAVATTCRAVDYFGYFIYGTPAPYSPLDVNLMQVDQGDARLQQAYRQAGIKSLMSNLLPAFFKPAPHTCTFTGPTSPGFDKWLDALGDDGARNIGAIYLDEPYWGLFFGDRHAYCGSYDEANKYIDGLAAYVKQRFVARYGFAPPVADVEPSPQVIMDKDFGGFAAHVDWAGFDWYPGVSSDAAWSALSSSYLRQLLARMQPGQQVVLVPQAKCAAPAGRSCLTEAQFQAVTARFLALVTPGRQPDISSRTVAVVPFFSNDAGQFSSDGTTHFSALRYPSIEAMYRSFARANVPALASRAASAAGPRASDAP
jgi:hypothetical protein